MMSLFKQYRKLIGLIFFTTLLFLNGCSGDKKLDGNRTLVFNTEDSIELNRSLINNFSIPKQESDKSWYGKANFQNKNIENYYFNADILKIKKIKTKPQFNGTSSIVVNNVLYEIRDNIKLYALHIENDKYDKIWKKKIKVNDELITNGKISYYGGKIFVATGYNEVISFNAENGSELWRKKLNSITLSSIIPDKNGNIYVITNDNKSYCLNSDTGEIKWIHSDNEIKTAILGAANPVIYNNYVIVSYSSGNIYVLSKDTGKEFFSADLNLPKITNFTLNDIDATPIVKGGILYTSGNGGLLMAINLTNFEILWKKEFPTITDFWISGNFIYIINNEAKIGAISRNTGEFLWINSLPQYKDVDDKTDKIVYYEIIMVNDFLLARNNYKNAIILNPINGQILGSIKNSNNIPLELFTRFSAE
jgi:outer membrane protein assembly factor BamB